MKNRCKPWNIRLTTIFLIYLNSYKKWQKEVFFEGDYPKITQIKAVVFNKINKYNDFLYNKISFKYIL